MKVIRLIIFIFSFFTWIFLNWSFDLENIIVGILVGILISFLTRDMFVRKPCAYRDIRRYLWFLYYVPLFIWECIKANIEGAYMVLHPDLPIRPGIVKVRTTLKSDTALTLLANTISLKPGTMTVDIDKEGGFLYVHWAHVEKTDVDAATKLIVLKFEEILKRIFE